MPRQSVVLCIDDNATGLNTRKVLLEAKDFRVFTAQDGPAGFAIANSEQIDVVILDFRLPGMDGGEVAKELRTTHPEIPILLLSGFPANRPYTGK